MSTDFETDNAAPESNRNSAKTLRSALADEMAAEMRRILDCGVTPAQMGWPGMTADELVISERQCWLEDVIPPSRKTKND
jgi:hypothetical protein